MSLSYHSLLAQESFVTQTSFYNLICTVQSFTATDYLETFADNPSDIYGASDVDNATMNAFTQTRKFVMAEYGLTEAEAWTVITQGVDFAITQLVDGNWGVHTVIPKAIFSGGIVMENITSPSKRSLEGEADLTLSPETVHWGFFSKELEPVLTIDSGSEIVVEMATHHACDDWYAQENCGFHSAVCTLIFSFPACSTGTK